MGGGVVKMATSRRVAAIKQTRASGISDYEYPGLFAVIIHRGV